MPVIDRLRIEINDVPQGMVVRNNHQDIICGVKLFDLPERLLGQTIVRKGKFRGSQERLAGALSRMKLLKNSPKTASGSEFLERRWRDGRREWHILRRPKQTYVVACIGSHENKRIRCARDTRKPADVAHGMTWRIQDVKRSIAKEVNSIKSSNFQTVAIFFEVDLSKVATLGIGIEQTAFGICWIARPVMVLEARTN